jgi:hypothetical protein
LCSIADNAPDATAESLPDLRGSSMSEARTVWLDWQTRHQASARRQRSGFMLAIAMLVAMTAAEVLFLTYVASPDTVEMVTVG